MTITEIIKILDAKVLTGGDKLDTEIVSACGTDMMSDALAFMHDRAMLLTGMANPHVVRTAEMLDLGCVLFVRGKMVPEEVQKMAEEREIILLSCERTLFDCCGLLYSAGIVGCERI